MSANDRRERFIWQPGMLERVDGPEPCQRVPHEPHADEHGNRPGFTVELSAAEERRVEELLEEAHFDVGEDTYGDWHSGVDR